MDEIMFVYTPDVCDPSIRFLSKMYLDESFHAVRQCFKDYPDELRRMEVSVYTIDEELIFSICGIIKKYSVNEKYKDIELFVADIYNYYFNFNCFVCY